jgi:hypothetical protein
MTTGEDAALLERSVARQLLLGLRESLTIAGELGRPVEAVNEALLRLGVVCDGCIVLTRPYRDEPRVVVRVVDGEALKRIAWMRGEP